MIRIDQIEDEVDENCPLQVWECEGGNHIAIHKMCS